MSRHGPVFELLAADHARLDALLLRAKAAAPTLDQEAYQAFRAGLLRHIAMEEKVLLPAARRLRGGEPLPEARRLRADHGLLASLLVAPPSLAVIEAIEAILEPHNRLEEHADGVYATCEALLGEAAAALRVQLEAVPAVPIARHVDSPAARAHVERILQARARSND